MNERRILLLVRVAFPVLLGIAGLIGGGALLGGFLLVVGGLGAFAGTAGGQMIQQPLRESDRARVDWRSLTRWSQRGLLLLIVFGLVQVATYSAAGEMTPAFVLLVVVLALGVFGGMFLRVIKRRH